MRSLRYFLATTAMLLLPAAAFAQVGPCGVATDDPANAQPVLVAPPPLPVYQQPPIPAPGYVWTPGYWSYASDDYYWVPGTWVQPPSTDVLWTPAYWGWYNDRYIFTAGHWGPHVGFYGGVNYGYGYNGSGYQGGRWDHGNFAYNRSVNNFGNTAITNVYDQHVTNNVTVNRVSFNGGPGGTAARPSAADQAFLHDPRMAATPAQIQHINAARNEPALRAAANHGQPGIAATDRPGELKEGIVASHGAAGGEPKPAVITPDRPDHAVAADPQHRPTGMEQHAAPHAPPAAGAARSAMPHQPMPGYEHGADPRIVTPREEAPLRGAAPGAQFHGMAPHEVPREMPREMPHGMPREAPEMRGPMPHAMEQHAAPREAPMERGPAGHEERREP